LIEDERYFWEVSQYIHLNPVRGKRPLTCHPRDWMWSSYRGYADKRQRLSWVAHDLLLAAWQSKSGGSDPAAAYRKYVEQGLANPPENPFSQAAHGFLLGGQTFVDKIRQEINLPRFADEVPRARLLQSVELDSVFTTVASYYMVDQEIFSKRGNPHRARAVAAWLARRLTAATLRKLSIPLGLGRPESVSNLTRRIDRDAAENAQLRQDLVKIEDRILEKTKNKV
jgi:hypothetical protein